MPLNLFFGGNLSIPDNTYLIRYHFEEALSAKISSFTFSLKYCKLIILGTLDMPGYAHLKKIISTYRGLLCLTSKKSTLSSMFSQRYCKDIYINSLFCMAMQTQNYSINLQKTSMSICMPKLNFTIHFFFRILHFKKSCSLIG